MNLRVAGLQKESIVDGPGVRMTIFFQGCSHRCPGCHNPETHDSGGGTKISVHQLLKQIKVLESIDGITLSGGEPFEQPEAAAALASGIVSFGMNLVIYSGYTFEQLISGCKENPPVRRLLELGWLLIDGPFLEAQQDLCLPFRGSRNQRIIDLSRSMKSEAPVEWAVYEQTVY
ncbi:MAG: 4Fe-4S single cluster domain-containing protein [Bacillota bacterium]|nr:4Fe-4S single cluster domain-containing protein [Bacillota bacterium]